MAPMDPLWADLINSDWHDHLGSGRREDRIGNDAWLARFLARAGWQGRGLPDAGEREELRRLRGLLRAIAFAFMAGEPIGRRRLDQLNGFLAQAPVVQRLAAHDGTLSMRLVPVGGPLAGLLGEVAASFAAMLTSGDPSRLRVCANADCRWVFYDESRNRSRRWCDAADCGNLIKVRRFRERRATSTTAGTSAAASRSSPRRRPG